MNHRFFGLLAASFIFVAIPAALRAQDATPSVNPQATFTNSDGETQTLSAGDSYGGSAPLEVTFSANAENTGGWTANYEWRFYDDEDTENAELIRYEETTTYTFTSAGSHRVYLYAYFIQGSDTIAFTSDDLQPITISISESRLEMPNAFSPNGDGINDVYKAKSGYQSITEFHAYIYNRWGTMLYDWTDPAGGWDGTYKGHNVKDGVYFCLVKAKGADGRNFNIKKDVNLLRGYTESTSTVTE